MVKTHAWVHTYTVHGTYHSPPLTAWHHALVSNYLACEHQKYHRMWLASFLFTHTATLCCVSICDEIHRKKLHPYLLLLFTLHSLHLIVWFYLCLLSFSLIAFQTETFQHEVIFQRVMNGFKSTWAHLWSWEGGIFTECALLYVVLANMTAILDLYWHQAVSPKSKSFQLTMPLKCAIHSHDY